MLFKGSASNTRYNSLAITIVGVIAKNYLTRNGENHRTLQLLVEPNRIN